MDKTPEPEKSGKKKKQGRPKGSQSLGIPIKTIDEAIELTKTLWEKAKSKIMSSAELTEYLNLKKGSNTPVIGALSDYGLIERVGDGWRVSELGNRAIDGDPVAVKEAFEKNQIFKELSIVYGDKDVTPGMIGDFIKKKYKKGDNVITIVNKFIKGNEYIKGLHGTSSKSKLRHVDYERGTSTIPKIIKLIELHYALEPSKDKDIEQLADDVFKDLNEEDQAIQTLAKSVKENKNNKEILKVLVRNIIDILTKKYPDLDDLKNKK